MAQYHEATATHANAAIVWTDDELARMAQIRERQLTTERRDSAVTRLAAQVEFALERGDVKKASREQLRSALENYREFARALAG